MQKKITKPSRRRAVLGSGDIFGLKEDKGTENTQPTIIKIDEKEEVNKSRHVHFGVINDPMLGTLSPVKRKSIKVDIDKGELDHLERAEKRTM